MRADSNFVVITFFIDLLTGNERAELYRLNYQELIPKANYENQTR